MPGSTAFRRRRCRVPPASRAPVLTERQKRCAQGAPHARRPRSGRGDHLVVHSARLRRRHSAAARMRSSLPIRSRRRCRRCGRACCRACSLGQAQPQPRLCRCRAVRAGASLSRRGAGGSVYRRRRRARRNRQARRAAAVTGTAAVAGRRPVRRQGRCRRRAGRARLRSREGADHARRTGLVSSRPLGHACGSGRRPCSRTSASCIRRR